ncbi:hypothetical protein VOLCADRAFT_87591 [Volvox carteri f. nagariensis]|uniref:Uncharacterized protein n=1 Tax=Volvox carteri f. nagariensis TaxID=3068 RepID=D8TLQ4_VOLCA|nr:uncharacterized protein VOLCADRAFT_87591 [Volvox carteri f. nagariensis]EFJ51508.1 hypothetical protein VOLCADRAFT_87591 [Volvox carteri f. nagariensis]|eukprot:XP_002947460.1 hypothetical protein VOLCADRAFT_87591 [Volvox carteri f. nagariensis]
MADCTLMALLQVTGQADGLAADALANLSHIPLIQHLAAVLSKEDNYVSPEDFEMAEVQTTYENNPDLADQEVQQLLDLRLSNPELFSLELADEPELREVIDAIAKQDELIKQGDARLARTRAHLATLHENSQAIRLQQQQADQGLARANRAVEQRTAAASSRNAADNCTAQAVQDCARLMQDLLHKSAERWLLLAHPLDELREIEKAITAEISRAKEQLSPAELARRLAEQQASQGALPDTPFAPSGTRMLTGLEPEQYATVLAEAGRIGTSGRMMRDRVERLQAELAGLQRQIDLLQHLADETAGGVTASSLGCVLGDWKQRLDPEAEARLRAETEMLEEQLRSLHDGEQRQTLLDQLAAVFTAQVKRALWLLRHQQLGYMTQLQRQLLEVLLQQWSRTEVVQVIRAEERRTLQDLYISLGAVCGELEEAARVAAADVEEFRSLSSGAEAQALLATDRGPQALLGGDNALCSAYTLLDCQRQRLQLLQERHEAGLAAQAAADAAAATAAGGAASGGLSQGKDGGGGGPGGGGGFTATQSLTSPRTAGSGAGGGFGGAAAAAGAAGNAFLDSVLSDPAHRTVSNLAAGVDAVLGLMGRLEQQVHHRVSGQLSKLVSEGRRRVEELRQMLAGPAGMAQSPQQQQQQLLVLANDSVQQQTTIQKQPQAGQQTTQMMASAGQQSSTSASSRSGVSGGGGGGGGGGGSARAGQKAQAWPVLRDQAFENELAGTKVDVERVLADIQVFVSRQNMLLDSHRRQSEQSRLERGVLAAFWNAPEQLLCDVQALRDRLAALLNSQ